MNLNFDFDLENGSKTSKLEKIDQNSIKWYIDVMIRLPLVITRIERRDMIWKTIDERHDQEEVRKMSVVSWEVWERWKYSSLQSQN